MKLAKRRPESMCNALSTTNVSDQPGVHESVGPSGIADPGSAPTARGRLFQETLLTRALSNSQLVGPLSLLVLLVILFSASTRSFLTVSNLTSMIQQNSVIAILGIGLTVVILLGEIDLSFPGLVLVAGAATGLLFTGNTIGLFVGSATFGGGSAITGPLFAVAVALALGCLTGFLVGRAQVPSFIGSLGVLLLSQGLAYYWLGGQATYTFPSWMINLGQKSSWRIPHIAILAGVLAIIVHLMLSRTILGRYIYMTGASPTAAQLSGINTRRLRVLVFSIAGLIAGIGGVAYAGNLASVNGASGNELLLPTFTAVVLGGNSLLGGSGGVKNTIVGVLIFSVLDNGLLLLKISSFSRPLIEGVALIVAVVLNVALSKLAVYADRKPAAERGLGVTP